MNTVKRVVAELFGLFVDDGRLAVSLLLLVLGVGVLVRLLPDQGVLLGGVLALGCLAILADATLRPRR